MNIIEEVNKLHELFPGGFLRMSHPLYTTVTYLHHVFIFYQLGKKDEVELFLKRMYREIERSINKEYFEEKGLVELEEGLMDFIEKIENHLDINARGRMVE